MPHNRHLIPSTLLASLAWLFVSMGCTQNQQEKGAVSHSEDIEQIEASSEVEPEVEASAKTVADPDSGEEITFEFQDMRPEIIQRGWKSRPDQLVVSGDTVFFEIYYGKKACRKYEYAFRKAGDSLIVLHQDLDMCMKHIGDHGIKGEIHGLRSGNYLFFLNRIHKKYNTTQRVLFKDSLVVK